MSARDAVRRQVLAAVAAAAIAVTLTGCGGAANSDTATNDGRSTTATSPTSKAADPTDNASADQPSDSATSSASPKATLPSGDPGPDAPGTDDPNGDLGNEGGQSDKNAAKTSVPPTAVLDTETVAAVAGGGWAASAAPADSCTVPRPAKAVATRSSQLTGLNTAAGSRIVETVGTHHGADAAVAAVHALERRLTRCHATSAPDPRIGDASVQLTLTGTDGTITVVTAVAAEGVTFVLSGSGPVTGAEHWSALTDIALGTTCVAAIDGCH